MLLLVVVVGNHLADRFQALPYVTESIVSSSSTNVRHWVYSAQHPQGCLYFTLAKARRFFVLWICEEPMVTVTEGLTNI